MDGYILDHLKNVTKRFRDYISLVHIVEQDPSKASRYNELIVDIVKYGWDNFEFKILDASVDMYDHELRAIREIEFITKYRSIIPKCGYNSTMGGETGNIIHKKYNTGKPKDIIIVDTCNNFSSFLCLNGTLSIHEEFGLTKMSIPDALRRGNLVKGSYFLFFANTDHRNHVAEYVNLNRNIVKSNGKNDDRAKARYKMYLKALESADACAKAYGY